MKVSEQLFVIRELRNKTKSMKTLGKEFRTKKGDLKVEYQKALSYIYSTVIRPVQQRGRGRYINYSDMTTKIVDVLNALGVKYQQGNDAPRGGKTGAFIRISQDDYEMIKNLEL